MGAHDAFKVNLTIYGLLTPRFSQLLRLQGRLRELFSCIVIAPVNAPV